MLPESWWNVTRGFHLYTFLLTLQLLVYGNVADSVKQPSGDFYNHDLTAPYMVHGRTKRDVHTRTEDGHLEELTLGYNAFGKNFLVDLRMNRDLFPTHFVERHHEKGSTVINKPYQNKTSHCYYHGKVRGVEGSWAAISTCHGVSGAVFDGQQMLYLEPEGHFLPSSLLSKEEDGSVPTEGKKKNRIFVYRDSDMKPQNQSCGYSGSSIHLQNNHLRFRRDLVAQLGSTIKGPFNSNKQSRYVELVLVNDHKEFKEMKSNKKAVIARSKEIANIVNALYSPLNIFVALVGVVVWSEFDQITLSKDGDTTLTNFLHYRRERLVSEIPNDNAQLITGITFEGGVVGKALKGPICTYEYSGGVNMDHSQIVALVATTVAHELGHNFGMEHDNDECECEDDRCIMAPSSSSTSPTHWSSCSLEYLHSAFEHGMDYCLRNRPTTILGPVCGNGFVEEGEQCDCGLKKFCNNPCCNATSCTLFANATCATGECCDLNTCKVKPAATICRHSEAECDLPEHCDGEREFCPQDVFKQDGTPCKHEKAYCYNGMCRSHSDQCKLLWGESGQMSDSRCFDQNRKGTASGNCGYFRLNQTYRPCDKEDILCGMLHCTHLNERLEFGMESVAILSRSFITTHGKILTCRSAIVDLGLNSVDPGLAPDGAKCGENKVCVNQKCTHVDDLRKQKCPNDCCGNGFCNSNVNCHCNVGYAPPYCDRPGAGGSEDSGPASDPHAQSITAFSYVFCFVAIAVFGFITCLFYYYRSHLRKWWVQKARETAIRSRAKEAEKRKKEARFSTVDRDGLRTVEISNPIQHELLPGKTLYKPPPPSPHSNKSQTSVLPPSPLAATHSTTLGRTHSVKAAKLNLDRNSLRNLEISHPIPQTEIVTNGHIVPVRPAPPRPTSPPPPSSTADQQQKQASIPIPLASVSAPSTAVVSRSNSVISGVGSQPSSNRGSMRLKRLSGPSHRPTNPPPRPPRPPPPKKSNGAASAASTAGVTMGPGSAPRSGNSEYAEVTYAPPSYEELYYDDCSTTTNNGKLSPSATQPPATPATAPGAAPSSSSSTGMILLDEIRVNLKDSPAGKLLSPLRHEPQQKQQQNGGERIYATIGNPTMRPSPLQHIYATPITTSSLSKNNNTATTTTAAARNNNTTTTARNNNTTGRNNNTTTTAARNNNTTSRNNNNPTTSFPRTTTNKSSLLAGTTTNKPSAAAAANKSAAAGTTNKSSAAAATINKPSTAAAAKSNHSSNNNNISSFSRPLLSAATRTPSLVASLTKRFEQSSSSSTPPCTTSSTSNGGVGVKSSSVKPNSIKPSNVKPSAKQ